jgi:large subunit ribosomal protein L29
MKTKEIREKDEATLKTEVETIRKELFQLRTQATTNKLEDPTKSGKLKKDVARILTVLREKATAPTSK